MIRPRLMLLIVAAVPLLGCGEEDPKARAERMVQDAASQFAEHERVAAPNRVTCTRIRSREARSKEMSSFDYRCEVRFGDGNGGWCVVRPAPLPGPQCNFMVGRNVG